MVTAAKYAPCTSAPQSGAIASVTPAGARIARVQQQEPGVFVAGTIQPASDVPKLLAAAGYGVLLGLQERWDDAAEAFLDYNFGAVHLSRLEVEALRAGAPLASDNKRENAEWDEKKKRLGM